MAALGRQVLGWRRLVPLPWARVSGLAPPCGQRRVTASSSRRLTPAASGGDLGELPRVEPRKYVQDPECRTNPIQGLVEKRGPPVDGGSSEREEVVRALLDMGFSAVQVDELLGIRPGAPLRQLLDVVSELILLGVHPEPVCAVLKKSPQLLKLPAAQMKRRASYLRRLGLGEGRLKRVLLCYPEVLSRRQRDLDGTVRVLRDKCLFTAQQVTEILHRCPFVLREDPGELELKFQYAYFRMGVRHADVVRTDFLQFSIAKIRQRHTFLERLGRYQTPDKKGQTQVPNPPLKDVLRVSEAEFLAKTACSSPEEFEVFKKLLAREEEEDAENHVPGDESISDEEDEDQDQDQDEEGREL